MPENIPAKPEPAKPEPAKPEPAKLLTLGDVAKTGLGAVVGVFVGVLLAVFGLWLNSASPRLTYETSAPLQFHGEKTKFGIITISVNNDGSKEAENIECTFSISGAKSPEIKITPESNSTHAIKNDVVTVKYPALNPGEGFTILAHTPDVLPNKLDVKVIKCKGFNGTERKPSDSQHQRDNFWVLICLGMVIVTALAIFFAANGEVQRLKWALKMKDDEMTTWKANQKVDEQRLQAVVEAIMSGIKKSDENKP